MITETTETKIVSSSARVVSAGDRLSYYIHDNSDSFRLEMRGSLTGDHISELEGCWRTAKSSVAGRRVQIDLRAVRHADAAGRNWLAEMARIENTEFVASPELTLELEAISSRVVKPSNYSRNRACTRLKSIFGGSAKRTAGLQTETRREKKVPVL